MRGENSTSRRLGATCLAAFAALVVAGCGGSDAPSTPTAPAALGGGDAAVANVADAAITKARFDRALRARVQGISALTPGNAAVVPLDAPKFRRCAAVTARQLRAAGAKGTPARRILVRNCALQYQQARAQTMSSLIQQEWVLQAAKEAGLNPSTAAVAAAVQAVRKQPGFARRLSRSGQTLDDVRSVLAAQMLTAQLVQKTVATKAPAQQQLKAFYASHPALFGTAGKRTIDLVVGSTPAEAERAVTALRKGKAVQNVVAGLTTGQTTRQGHITVTDGDGQLAPAVNTAVFAAKKGRPVGPVKAGTLYYGAVVRSVTPAKVPPFAKVENQVRQQYLAQRASTAQTAFQAKLAKTWRPKTRCAKGYLVAECGNAPAPKTTTTS